MSKRVFRGTLAGAILLVMGVAAVFAPYLYAIRMYAMSNGPVIGSHPQALSPSMRVFDNWFVVEKIGTDTYAIGEPAYGQCNFSYFFVGKDKALLWDTGPGLRDIKKVTDALTQLPVTATPSHLHFDHTGGLKFFRDVGLPDLAELKNRTAQGELHLRPFESLSMIERSSVSNIHVNQWLPLTAPINLGERSVTIFPSPGHSDNSMVLRDDRTGNLFTGDTIYPGNVWEFLPGSDLEAYEHSLIQLVTLVRPRTILFGGHGCANATRRLSVPGLPGSTLTRLLKAVKTARGQNFSGSYPTSIQATSQVTLLSKKPWMAK